MKFHCIHLEALGAFSLSVLYIATKTKQARLMQNNYLTIKTSRFVVYTISFMSLAHNVYLLNNCMYIIPDYNMYVYMLQNKNSAEIAG